MAWPVLVSAVALGVLAGLTLLVAGQPLFTDDAWLHLALGEAYAASGPWLERDPMLAVSPGPPTPAAWLYDVLLHHVHRGAGFTGLRLLHVGFVVAILALAWRVSRRASGSRLFAYLATTLFVTLSAYRLVQLRPHLFTMLAVLIVVAVAFDRERAIGRRQVAMLAVLFAVWANVHAAFLLGPILLAAGASGLVAAALVRGDHRRATDLSRARSLAIACIAGSVATLLNPAGLRPHLAFFVAGSETPALGRVADEWSRVDLFSAPPVDLPPSWLSWLIVWGLVLGTVAAVTWAMRSMRSDAGAAGESADAEAIVDPALLALAVVGCALPLVAVRFLWLGILPLLMLGDVLRRHQWVSTAVAPRLRWAAAALACLLVPAYLLVGPWPMVSVALPGTVAGYRQPYHAGKYHANLVWMIHDAGLEGTLFSEYHIAGFAGRHLAPQVRSLVNGTLNVAPEVIAANLPIRLRQGQRDGERFVELLDRHGVDLFVGIRLPRFSASSRPWFHTTAHLERTDGWVPIFRNLNGAVYLRANERNRENFERVARYYESLSISFDPEVGFEAGEVISSKRRWAIRQGLVPVNFDRLVVAAYGTDPVGKSYARDRLASIYAVLGLYERALEIDRVDLRADAARNRVRRRVVWCQLRLGRFEEAAATAEPLGDAPAQDHASHALRDAALRVASMSDEEERRSLVATLPLFTRQETGALMRGILGPSPRPEL